MRQSFLFTKTRKESPKDEVSKNADLLIRAGYIHKEMAGAYALLPLGLKVIKKIEQIVREEMNAIGAQEVEMTTLQDKEKWEKAGKWDDEVVDVWFKTKLKNDTELGLAFSHEEAFADLLKDHLNSYKDFPKYIYQFQTKFRNELRAKSGIMRGREFYMKDMYSFNKTNEDLYEFYNQAYKAYQIVFERVGIGEITYPTHADGSVFGDKSHEFQTLSEVGEDNIYLDEEKGIAINEEIYSDEKLEEFGLDKEKLVMKKSIEVGNIFPIEDKVAKKMEFTYMDEEGKPQDVIMGSYGIGLGRLMGTVVEVLSDEKGIVWPESISPFKVHLISLNTDNEEVKEKAESIYKKLQEENIEVLYDDRDKGAGEKFSDSDLIGIPKRIVVSKKSLEEGKLEIIDRKTGNVTLVEESDIVRNI